MIRLEFDRHNPALWCELGIAMHALREHRRALDAFDNALALQPGMEEARIGRAVVRASLELRQVPAC